jgi:hypothetical protein
MGYEFLLKSWGWPLSIRYQLSARKVTEFILAVLAIVAAYQGFEWLTLEPKISIQARTIGPIGYFPSEIREFYDSHLEGKMPVQLIKYFEADSSERSDSLVTKPLSDGSCGLDFILKYQQSNDTEWLDKWFSASLNDRFQGFLDTTEFEKHIYGTKVGRAMYPTGTMEEIIANTSSLITPFESFVLKNALLYGRLHNNAIYVKNEGQTDLFDIDIVIPAPLSPVTDSRDGNILRCDSASSRVIDVTCDGNQVTVHSNLLKPNDFFSVSIVSRAFPISEDEVEYTYEAEKRLDQSRLWWSIFFVALGLLLLMWLFRGPQGKYRGVGPL